MQDRIRQPRPRVFGESSTPRSHFVEHAAQRVDVRPHIESFAAQLLWRHVRQCPGYPLRLGESLRRSGIPVRPQQLCQAKVQYLRLSLGSDEDVPRLEITVDNPLLVRFLECCCELRA